MPQFDGSYTRQAGDTPAYTYKLTYGVRGKVLSWSATVHQGDADCGHASGDFAYDLPPTEEEQRRKAQELAHAAIEAGAFNPD